VAIQPASGAIRALVGGRRYRESPFNRATRQALASPVRSSSLLVYLAAFEAERAGRDAGLTPASLVLDDPSRFRSAPVSGCRRTSTVGSRGPVTVRTALVASLTSRRFVWRRTWASTKWSTWPSLGIARPLAAVPSLALGTSEVTLLEITAAYATLANGGVRAAPTTLPQSRPPQGALAVEPIPA